MKNIFLFGAGASYGSGGLNYLIPLGSQLFCDLRKHFPNTWGSLPVTLSTLFEDDFEKGMEIIWREHSNNIGILMQDMAVFFSKIRISNIDQNLYVKLLGELKARKLLSESAISTLNYDCLVELATIPNKISVNYFSTPDIKQDSLLIWKLHGSCNFVLDGITATRAMQYRAAATFNGAGLKAIQIGEVESYCRGDNALYPAMSIFMRNKPNQIGKSCIEAMQEKWKEWILNSEKIFLVGVNPYFEDTHIWQPLSETKSKIYFCGNKNSFEEWQNLKNRNDEYIGDKFENSINIITSNL